MALALECLNYNIVIFKDSIDSSTSITTVFPYPTWYYYIQITDCCTGLNQVYRLDQIVPGWDYADGTNVFYYNDLRNWGVPPQIWVEHQTTGEIRVIPTTDYGQDGWLSISQNGGVVFPNCSTTTTTSTTTLATTTKEPLNFVFRSACDGVTHSTILNFQFWQKVICLRSPLEAVYALSGTVSTLVPSGSWGSRFLQETSQVIGPNCNCSCATQSLNCSKIKVTSSFPKTFRYVDCESGNVEEQLLDVGSWERTEKPTLISVPNVCSTAITNTLTKVNFQQSQGYVDAPGCSGFGCYSYNGPYGYLMSATNSEYTAPVSGNYTITSQIRMSVLTEGNNATNSVTLSLKRRKASDNSVSTLFNREWFSRYSDSGRYGWTISISGSGSFGLSAGDKTYLEIIKSSQLVAATYSSMICTGGLTRTSSGHVSANNGGYLWFNRDLSNPNGRSGPFYLSFTMGAFGNGYNYVLPYGPRQYIFGWNLSGTYAIVSHSQVNSFNLELVPVFSSVSPVLQRQLIEVSSGQTGSFNFVMGSYSRTLFAGLTAGLALFARSYETTSSIYSLQIQVTLFTSSIFSIYSAGDWANSSRLSSYFEVSDAPLYSTTPTSYGYTFCVRTPLQNQPPIQSIGDPGTFSACQGPIAGLYFPLCNPAISTGDCGSWVRSSVEIFGTQCSWASSPSTPTTTDPTYQQLAPVFSTFSAGSPPAIGTKCTNACDKYILYNNDPDNDTTVTWTKCDGSGTGNITLPANSGTEICACGQPFAIPSTVIFMMGMRYECSPAINIASTYSCQRYRLTRGNRTRQGLDPETGWEYFECDSANPYYKLYNLTLVNGSDQEICAVEGTVKRYPNTGNGTFSLASSLFTCAEISDFPSLQLPGLTFSGTTQSTGNFSVALKAYNFTDIGSLTAHINHNNLSLVSYQIVGSGLTGSTGLFFNIGSYSSFAWYDITNPVTINNEVILIMTFSAVSSSRLQWMFTQNNNSGVGNLNGDPTYTRFYEGFVKFSGSDLPPFQNFGGQVTAVTTLPPTSPSANIVLGRIYYVNGAGSPILPSYGTLIEIWGSYSTPVPYFGHSYSATVSPYPGDTAGAVLMRSIIPDTSGNFSFSTATGFSDSLTYSIRVVTSTPHGGINASSPGGIARHVNNLSSLTGIRLAAADCNRSGTVTSTDALICLRRVVGLIGTFSSGDWIFHVSGFTSSNFNLSGLTGSAGTGRTMNIESLCIGDVNVKYTPPTV